MEILHLTEWMHRVQLTQDSQERRAALRAIEPLIEGLERAERDVLFPVLRKFLGFRDWMQEAAAHHRSFRELIDVSKGLTEHQRVLEISDEFVARLSRYLEGMERILYPRLIQTLNRTELIELRNRLGDFWLFRELSDPVAA